MGLAQSWDMMFVMARNVICHGDAVLHVDAQPFWPDVQSSQGSRLKHRRFRSVGMVAESNFQELLADSSLWADAALELMATAVEVSSRAGANDAPQPHPAADAAAPSPSASLGERTPTDPGPSVSSPGSAAASSCDPLETSSASTASSVPFCQHVRKRLRSKTPLTRSPTEIVLPMWSSLECESETQEEWEAASERAKYFRFRRRLNAWVWECVKSLPPDHSPATHLEACLQKCGLDWTASPTDCKRVVSAAFVEGPAIPAYVRSWAAGSWKYLADADLEIGPGGPTGAAFHYARSGVFTWQGPWGVLEVGILEHRTLENVIAALKRLPEVTALWREFEHFAREVSDRLHVINWAASMEVCTDTFAASGVVRVHFHWAHKCDHKVFIGKPQAVTFRGTVPHRTLALSCLQQRQGGGWCAM